MSLRADRRAQSIQIGAILLFAILVVLFAVYQAVIIPGQNREVEFDHNQRVEGDMVELRNTFLETFSAGVDGYTSVELGTQFPPRLIALNPPDPSGTIRSGDRRPIVIEDDGTDITDTVCPGEDHRTRAVEYSPNYAQYQEAGEIRFENTLLYHRFADGTVRLTDQALIRNQTVQIIPITGNLSAGGTQTLAVEPIPGLLDSSQRNGINVTVPTALSQDQWERALQGQVAPSNVEVTSGAGGQNLTLTLPGTRRIECGPVGLGSVPPSGGRGSGLDEINPASPGEIQLMDVSLSGSEVTLTFNNSGGTNNFTEGRWNFYQGTGNTPDEVDINRLGEPSSATLILGEEFETFDPPITLQGGGTETQVVLDFNASPNTNQDWFVLTFKLETGETGLYFVSP
jgi:FlaG/FlaF family flagellin (archaellin)